MSRSVPEKKTSLRLDKVWLWKCLNSLRVEQPHPCISEQIINIICSECTFLEDRSTLKIEECTHFCDNTNYSFSETFYLILKTSDRHES